MRLACASWLASLLVGSLASAAAAQGASAKGREAVDEAPVRCTLVAAQDGVVAGSTVRLGVLLDIREGWHVYAPAVNDSGIPVKIEVLPTGFAAASDLWPAPVRLTSPGDLLDHVYEGRVLLPFDDSASSLRPGSTLSSQVKVWWMACRSVCTLGDAELSLDLPVKASAADVHASADAALFEQARSLQPRPLATAGDALRVAWQGDALVVSAPGAAGMCFIPDEGGPVWADLLHAGAADGESLTLHLRDRPAPPAAARGIVTVRWPGDRPAASFRIDVPFPASPAPGGDSRAPSSQESDDAR